MVSLCMYHSFGMPKLPYPNGGSVREGVQQMTHNLFVLETKNALGGTLDPSMSEVFYHEDSSPNHKPNNGSNLRPWIGLPYLPPYSMLSLLVANSDIVGLLDVEHTLLSITPL